MNLYKFFAFIVILQVAPLYAAQDNNPILPFHNRDDESARKTFKLNRELALLSINHQDFCISLQEYQTLSQGWELAGLQNLPEFISEQLTTDLTEEPHTANPDIEQTTTISDIVTTNIKNIIIEEFEKNKSYQSAFSQTLQDIINNKIDLDQIPNSEKCWGLNYPRLSWLNDPQHNPVFEYCDKNPFMKPVVQHYVTKIYWRGLPRFIELSMMYNCSDQGLQFAMKHYDFNQSERDKLLKEAVTNNSDKVIPLLITQGANIKQCDDKDNNLLHVAARNSAAKSIPLLTEYIDINQTNQLGLTPLHIASGHRFSRGLTTALLKNGANVHSKDVTGKTALHIAAHKINEEAVNLLLADHAQVNDRDNNNQTPLHAICTCTISDSVDASNIVVWAIMSQLVDAGADLEALDNANKKPRDYSNLLTAVLLFKNRS